MAFLKNCFLLVKLIVISVFFQSCLPVHALWLGQPDKNDAKRFRSRLLKTNEPANTLAKSMSDYSQLKINDWTSDVPVFKSLKAVLSSHNSNGFMLIRKDTILYEDYFRGASAMSKHTSYSVAKSFVSLCLGIAVKKQLIKSLDDPIIDYLPQLSKIVKINKVRVCDILNHTSGIKQKLTMDAHLYYGSIQKALKQIEIYRTPGTHQEYLNINTQLLSLLIEKVSGQTIDQFFYDHIWSKLGTEDEAFWSVDRKNDIVKAYCCFNASIRDYAKIGQLICNNGKKDNKQIIPVEWLNQSFCRDTSRGSSFNYNHSWHLGIKEYNDVMAIGLYKQYIYIHPDKKITMVLFNDRENKLKEELVDWIYIFRQVVDQI